MRAGKTILTVFFAAALSLTAAGQIDDVGLWAGVKVTKKVTREFDISINPEYRFNHDVTTLDAFLTDVGLEYEIVRSVRVSLHYRFINSNRDNYYSKRHRLYADLAYRYKLKDFTFQVRGRIQQQYTDINSSEFGKYPVWTIRTKLGVRYDFGKKYTPYVSGELYYLLKDVTEADGIFTRNRYEAGFTYDFNRLHGINPFLLFQHNRITGFDELVYGIGYSVTL